jgi:MFS family permease
MPLMIAAIVTSIGAGQILARTGRYKVIVIAGFAAVVAGAYLLSRMGVTTPRATVLRNMIIMGLGLGVAMSAFTVIVQNQYPARRLGEVSAGLQFFRFIGATIGLAVFGTILNNKFASSLSASLSPQLQALTGSSPGLQLDNPQVLLSAEVRTQLSAAFDKLGPQGHSLFVDFMEAVRHSLAAALSNPFLPAVFVSVVV